MDVLYTCDNNYIWIMGISVISLFENNKHIDDLTVYLLGEKITDENKDILKKIGNQYNRKIEIIIVPELEIPELPVSARWPLSAFTRLFVGQLLPGNISRILYLDCDTIICDDLQDLKQEDMGKNIICGIKDCLSGLYKNNIGLDFDSVYINAGVLLINLELLRKVDIKQVIDDFMKRYIKLINYGDQDILNSIFKGQIGVIEPRYNVMTIDMAHSYKEIQTLRRPTNFYSEDEMEDAINKPTIIHYTTNMRIVRPWYSNTNHPMANLFRYYMHMSPWRERKLTPQMFASDVAGVIGFIEQFPRVISCVLLGLIHSRLKPLYIRVKARGFGRWLK